MIDLHCHMLPNIDDGPESLSEALQMARIAVANGIVRTVVTPHIHPGRYENTRMSIHSAYVQFRESVEREGIRLNLHMAAEVRIGPEALRLIQQNHIPWLGVLEGYRVLLLEFPHSHIPPGSDKLVQWCLARKILPLIAHPERNKYVLRDLDKIKPFVEMGCLLQVTAGSLTGNFGPVAKQRAYQLLERGWIYLLATDAHNTTVRIPDLESGRAAAAAIVGDRSSWKLVRDHPNQLLAQVTVPTTQARLSA